MPIIEEGWWSLEECIRVDLRDASVRDLPELIGLFDCCLLVVVDALTVDREADASLVSIASTDAAPG